MEFGSGNPYLQGENPFMQGQPGEPPVNGSPNAQTPASGGMDLGGGGVAETTKPRQMPGGSDPLADPMGGPAPSIPGGDTNTPQPSMDAKALLRQVRAEIKASNPEVTVHDAHVIALRVVALIAEGASPMGPAPQYTDPTPDRHAVPRRTRLNLDPRDPTSPAHPSHPQHLQYRQWMQNQQKSQQEFHDPTQEQGDEGQAKSWQSQYGGRNPLEDRAYMRGYQGQNPNLFGLADTAIEMFRQRNKGKTPPATRSGQAGARQLP